MNAKNLPPLFVLAALALTGAGCGLEPATPAKSDNEKKPKPVMAKKTKLGKNVFLEVQGDKRRVLINAYVCLREGALEQLLTRARTKEHEAILAADVDARLIHAALLAARAKPGSTVRYKKVGEKVVIVPPRGTPIKVTLQYRDKKKKLVTVAAQQWVRNIKTKKHLNLDWVFAGSVFFKDPLNPKTMLYGANSGDVICVANFDGAMLDLPISSSKDNADLSFEAYTKRIPPLRTKVTIILEPVLKAKKKK
jgi:hypothetical protein